MTTEPECNGICMNGYDIGLESSGIAYPHPDCELHGDGWTPHDNEWSRRYVIEHPRRLGKQAVQEAIRDEFNRRLGDDDDEDPGY